MHGKSKKFRIKNLNQRKIFFWIFIAVRRIRFRFVQKLKFRKKVKKLTFYKVLFFKINKFINTLIKKNIFIKRNIFFIYFLLLFLFLLVSNLIGLIPFSYVITSYLIIIFFLSSSFFIGLNILGCYLHKIQFFNFFLPSGIPLYISPLYVLIEVINYFAKICSLTLRLFSNIVSSHILVKVIFSIIWSSFYFFNIYNIFFWIFPMIVALFICLLEVFVSILQAYIFTMLTIIYLSDVIILH